MKKYKLLDEAKDQLSNLRNNGRTRGKNIGFPVQVIDYSVKEGCTTYIVGAPHSGKTEFWMEVLINLSCKYQWRHVIFSPETGDVADIYAELMHKFIGKPYFEIDGEKMNDSERTKAEYFISEYFIVVDPADENLSIDDFYQEVDKIEKELGKKIHTTTIDPFNEIAHDFSKDSGRQDLYIERVLGDCRKNSRRTGRHNCIITHARDQQSINQNGITYYPPPTARDYAGGQAWFRKGLGMIAVWRPPYGIADGDGKPYEMNETHVIIQKSKPKGVSTNGTYKIFYDKKLNAYYHKDSNGNKYFADRVMNAPQEEISYESNKGLENFRSESNFMDEGIDMPF